jgi:hypothetical protein
MVVKIYWLSSTRFEIRAVRFQREEIGIGGAVLLKHGQGKMVNDN